MPLLPGRISAAILAISLAVSGAVHAQAFPAKTITLIIGANPGGTIDPISRLLADVMGRNLDARVVVENMSGANGNIAGAHIAKSAPDGYKVMMATSGMMANNPHLYGAAKMGFDVQKDLTPIVLYADVPNILVVHPSIPVTTVKEFTEYAQKNPGRLNFGSTGNGSAMHLAGELFKIRTGTTMSHVPYNSPGMATQDLLAGNTQLMFQLMTGIVGQVKSGKVRPIAVLSKKRSVALPEVPTFAESGMPLESSAWFMLVGPPRLPEAVVERLNLEVNKALQDEGLKGKFRDLGVEQMGGASTQAAEFLASELKKWGELVRSTGARID